MNIQAKIKFLFSLLIISLSCGLNAAYAEPLDKIVAIVNDDIVTQQELDDRHKLILTRVPEDAQLPPRHVFEKQILDKLILEKLQIQLAKKQDISVDSITINSAIKDIAKNSNLSAQEFLEMINKLGVSSKYYRENIKNELILRELQRREIGIETIVTDSEVESFVNSPIGQDLSGTKYLIGHILLAFPEKATPNIIKDLEKQAYELTNKLKNGEDFSQMAMAKSSGQNALEGGNLGWRTIGEIPTLFVNYVASMNINNVRGPIKSSSGFHIIKLLEKKVGQEKLHQEIHVRQILLTPNEKLSNNQAKAQLEKIRSKILNGEKFVKLAQEKSTELGSRSRGGDLGWINKKSVVPKFFDTISKLKVNELSQPFQTELGWHLVEVLGKRNSNDSLTAARNRARYILHDKKFNEKLELWLQNLKANSKVELLAYN